MENSEILGFQFEPNKALQTDSRSGESWEICFRFLLRLYLMSQSLHCILHVIIPYKYTLFYKKLIYKKLGLAWFKTQEASRAAIIFLAIFSYVKN